MFFKQVGVKDSNGAGILAILEALRIYQCSFQLSLRVESNSINAVSCARTFRGPWKMHFYSNEIKGLTTGIYFQHVSRSANGMADTFSKTRGGSTM